MSTLVANHVGPGATKTCGAHCLMGIHHDTMLHSLCDGIVIVVDDGLTVMVLAIRDDLTHITTLHSIIAVFIH